MGLRKKIQNWKVHIIMGQTKKERVHILVGRRGYKLKLDEIEKYLFYIIFIEVLCVYYK